MACYPYAADSKLPPTQACIFFLSGKWQSLATILLVQAEYLLSRVMLLKEGIDDTEDLIQIELDQR